MRRFYEQSVVETSNATTKFLSIIILHLKGNATVHSLNNMSTFRIELYLYLWFVSIYPLFWTWDDTFVSIVAWLFWFFVNRKHTGIQSFVLAEIVRLELLAVELKPILGRMWTNLSVEVKLPLGIGPHLIVS